MTDYCCDSIMPTTSPSFDVLKRVGECPNGWSGQIYNEGDHVLTNDLMYECKSWPQSTLCGQAGCDPGTSLGSGGVVVE